MLRLNVGLRSSCFVGEWETLRLGDVCEGIFDGPHATPPTHDGGGPIFLGISSLCDGRLDLSTTRHVSEEDFRKWTRRVEPTEGDVVFSYETRLGEAAIIPPGLRCCLGRRMGLLRPDRSRVLPSFLLYAYLAPEFQEILRQHTVQGSTVDRILLTELPDFPIRVPSLDEQARIAGLLGSIDAKIETNERVAEAAEQLAGTLYRLICGDGAESEGWPVMELGDFVEVTKGVSYSSSEIAPSSTALLTLKSFRRGGGYRTGGLKPYTGTKFKEAQVVTAGDVVVAHTDLTQDAAVIGAAARVPASAEGYNHLVVSLDVAVVRPREAWLTPEALFGALRWTDFQSHALGYANGTTVLHLDRLAIPNYPYVVPPEDHVRRFTSLAEPLFTRIDRCAEESVVLGMMRDLLLPFLFDRDAPIAVGARTSELIREGGVVSE
jgi:type I restriction enzyme, S subunit